MTGAAMLKAAGLWAKTSAKGNRYLCGRLGGVKLLILANHNRAGEADPTHVLYFAEAPDKPHAAPQDARTAPGDGFGTPDLAHARGDTKTQGLSPSPSFTRRGTSARPAVQADDPMPFNDKLIGGEGVLK